ncbi:hypothetical protein [Kribbella catacumbae]|uniref:hypothetical protein n=1 Tax=Kribbella catacumbae TaxID=460086 RepID=UPI0012FC265A|nr:hypothetical protein [Kribbella catacumbae]
MSIQDILNECAVKYSQPQRLHGEDSFRFACSVSFVPDGGRGLAGGEAGIPDELTEFWRVCDSAKLFFDVDYGQWGLSLLNQEDSHARTVEYAEMRSADTRPGDVVVGEFLGDLDLLVLAPSESGSSRIRVGLPLDPRAEWYSVGRDLEDFLKRYVGSLGRKFWVD